MLTALSLIWGQLDNIFAILFAIHATAVVITRITPTTKDDAIVAKALTVIESLASILSVKRKDFPEAPTTQGLH